MKASAVAVASGGLVATFALPASAATATEDPRVTAAAGGSTAALPQIAGQTVAVAAPAVDNAVSPTFGVGGFTAQPPAQAAPAPLTITKIAKEAPAPAPAPARAPAPAPTRAPAPAPTRAPAPAPAPAAAPARATTTPASRTATRTAAPAPTATANPAPAPAPAPTGGIIGIAASLSGIYYRYGGTTTAGFDCSGFTSYVYSQVGKSIPRTAEAQRAASSKVSNPVPGDLIFFGFPAYHVGIFAGAGQMYDSPHTGATTGLHVIWTQTNVSYGRF